MLSHSAAAGYLTHACVCCTHTLFIALLLLQFEKGLGGMLKNAWNHIEALQTSDLPMLIDHISAVFNDAAKR
jgi:hypothetical protein